MQDRLTFAFDNVKSSDWEKFELFSSAFLASYYPELRTVAKPHDGGRDSELFSPVGKPQIVFQYSITESWESKIRSTIKRLTTNNPIGEKIIKLNYVTNQKIGPAADKIKSEVLNSFNIVLDIFDRTYFLERLSNERIEIAESFCRKIVDPILKAQNLFNSGIQSFENLELQMAHLFLSLQVEDQNQSQNLTKKVYESIVLSILRETSSANRMQYDAIIAGAINLLPEHPREVVKMYIDLALERLKKRKIKYWQKENEYCLSNSMIDELSSKTAIFNQRIKKVGDIIRSNLPKGVEVSAVFTDKVLSFIEQFLYKRGDVFCLSILDQKEVSLSTEDLSDLVDRNFNDFKQEIYQPQKLDTNILTAILKNCMLAAFNSTDKDLNLLWLIM